MSAKSRMNNTVTVVGGLATGTNPHGRARAKGAQESYQGEERARWGWVPLQMERSLKGLELKEGRTQPQLAERTARSDGMARGEKG